MRAPSLPNHGTRVADWIDLAAPFLVLVPALVGVAGAVALVSLLVGTRLALA